MLLWQLPQQHREFATHPALIFQDRRVTYGELVEWIGAYAGMFQAMGVQPGERVTICAPNCPEFIYSYLGAIQAGAIVVPLNLMLTRDEIAYIVKDAGCSTLVIHRAIVERLNLVPQMATALGLKHLVVLDETTAARAKAAPPATMVAAKEEDICVFLYTSGTTGRPKGAMLSHRNFLADIKAMDAVSNLGPEDNFLCVLPMFHSFAWTTSVLLPLYLGSTITIKESFQPKDTLKTLSEGDITVFCGVPSIYAVLWRLAEEGQFKSLKFAISGGAPLAAEIQRGFEAKFAFPLVEGYGLSEAAPVVCLNPLDGVRKPGSIGIPLPGMEVRLVDDDDREVPRGEVGELVVRGPNVMAGYYNHPEETAAALRGGWLHTGDLARQDEDGYFYIVDRKKDLIILGGFNVYPREVEEVLLTHPAVLEAAVVGVGDPVKGETVKAYVVLKEGESADRRQLQDFLKEHLALYKIPRLFEFVPELPKSPTGKVMKKLLKTR
ncbi:Long-chain-fatty-acid--CoA ligase [Moorella thermoacetica]|uniref:long-chain-fatty-acid--CoA ligase n=1 Tax=Neomoorella thermoacetica TaxID=1525 RepID=UPI0030D34B7C